MDAIPNGATAPAPAPVSCSVSCSGRSTPSGVHILAGPSQPPSNLASGASSLHSAEAFDYDADLRPVPDAVLAALPAESRQVLTTFAQCPRPKADE